MKIYVDINASQGGNGTQEAPFTRIQSAADIAKPGDEVIVAPGVYRENVDPACGGEADARITYTSSKLHGAEITGAEEVKDWVLVDADNKVWKAEVDNSVFTDRNPYTTLISGDWYSAHYLAHTGEVYLNDKSLYEVAEMDGVTHPKVYVPSWDPEGTLLTWYTVQSEDEKTTIIYANFGDANPNEEKVEINARKACFFPSKTGCGYITLSGFKICKAASQWAPPTAFQEGMIGPHWSKGWIIEDCEVSHSKCSGISLGKYLQPENNNKWLHKKYKDGAQTQREVVCLAANAGWSLDTVGSHIVRNCEIHHCGQTGIVGHLGGVCSVIEGNHIHHINNKQNLAGAEIGGIKMHAAIDVIYRNNHFEYCTRGMWLDWQAQGTRVTGNLFNDNTFPNDANLREECLDGLGEDLFIEISHGPTLVDNNIFLSDHALKLPTQGVACVHNLIAGSITAVCRGVNNGTPTLPSPRYTPYHAHHSTAIVGFMTILHGDMRFYNNIFVQRPVRPGMETLHEIMKDNEWTDCNMIAGTVPYDSFPTQAEYEKIFEGYCGHGIPAGNKYYDKLPVWAEGNVYLAGAVAMSKETAALVDDKAQVILELSGEKNDQLNTNVLELVSAVNVEKVTTLTLGEAFEPEQRFENPDGSEIVFDTDYYGNKRTGNIIPGPFAK